MDTGTVRVRLPQNPPPSPPGGNGRRFALLGGMFAALGLVAFFAFAVAERSTVGVAGPSPMAARPGETLEVLDGPVTSDGRFLDPVTREPLDPATAPYQADLYGTTFYFGSRASFDRFREDPLKYVKARVKVNVQLQPEPAAPPTEPAAVPTEAPVEEGLPPAPGDVASPGGDAQWSVPAEAPPPIEEGPPDPAEPIEGGSEPGWLPPAPGESPAAASPKPPAPPQDEDVIVQPPPPLPSEVKPVPDEGDVIISDPPAGPAGPPTPLKR